MSERATRKPSPPPTPNTALQRARRRSDQAGSSPAVRLRGVVISQTASTPSNTAQHPETPTGPGCPPIDRCTSAAPWILGAGTLSAGIVTGPTSMYSVVLTAEIEETTNRSSPTLTE